MPQDQGCTQNNWQPDTGEQCIKSLNKSIVQLPFLITVVVTLVRFMTPKARLARFHPLWPIRSGKGLGATLRKPPGQLSLGFGVLPLIVKNSVYYGNRKRYTFPS